MSCRKPRCIWNLTIIMDMKQYNNKLLYILKTLIPDTLSCVHTCVCTCQCACVCVNVSRVQDYLDFETRYCNDVILSLRFG